MKHPKFIAGTVAVAAVLIVVGINSQPKGAATTDAPAATPYPSFSQADVCAADPSLCDPAPTVAAVPTAVPGPTLTDQQQQAVGQAQDYLSSMGFSRKGLIAQLDSPYGGQFSVADATIAVNSLGEDWNAEAVQSAKDYLATEHFSCNGLVAQLDSQYGGQFTVAQAKYGAKQAGAC